MRTCSTNVVYVDLKSISSITREEFEQIAGNIVKLFPNEIADSYYTAAQGSVQVQGKLYTAYNKLKARLREVGLITKRPKSRPRDRTYSDNRTRTELPFDDTVQSNTALNLMSVSCSKSGNIIVYISMIVYFDKKNNSR